TVAARAADIRLRMAPLPIFLKNAVRHDFYRPAKPLARKRGRRRFVSTPSRHAARPWFMTAPSLSSALAGRKVLLIIGGGIAAYKALELIRLLSKAGVEVMTVLTRAGAEFVTPMSLAALTGHPVRQDLFMPDYEAALCHIELSRWADLVVVPPATAGLIVKAVNGMADDLASTTLLATDKKVLLAPAMNVRMWLHPAVQANVARLKGF